MKVVVVGSSTAGMTAASKLKRILKEKVEVVTYQKLKYPSLGSCGIPYYVGNNFENPNSMIARSVDEFKTNGIIVHVECEITNIDFEKKIVSGVNYQTNNAFNDTYDKLVISVGAEPRKLNIEGETATNVYTGTTLEDAIALHDKLGEIKNITIIGGGFIGLEFCESFGVNDKNVTLVEYDKWVSRKAIDNEIAQLLQTDLIKKGINLKLETRVTKFILEGDKVTNIQLSTGEIIATDLVLIAIGIVPSTKFLEGTKILRNSFGAILINDQLETNIKDVYAIGDCVMTTNLIDGSKAYMALATIAAKSGKVLGNILAGKKDHFPGGIGTAIFQVFESEVARTGYTEEQACDLGYNVKQILVSGKDHTHYIGIPRPITIKIIYDIDKKIMLGAQIFGYNKATLRINALIPIIWFKIKIDEIEYLDLPYSPPFAKSVDVLNVVLAKLNEK